MVCAVSGRAYRRTRRNFAITCSCCARRDSTGSIRTGRRSSFRRRNRCWTSISAGRCWCWWIACRSAATCISASSIRSRSVIAKSGEVVFEQAGGEGKRLRFSEKFACKTCGLEFRTPEPGLFSFNNPTGACPRCQGFGNTIDYDLDLVIPDTSLSLEEGAVDPWTKPQHEWAWKHFRAEHKGKVRFNVPFCDLDPKERALIVAAIREYFAEVEEKKYKVHVRVFLSRYRGYAQCPECNGSRLRKEALYVRVGDKTIADLTRMNTAEALRFFESLEISPEENAIAEKMLVEVRQRLKFLNDVGLHYLTLERLSATLSGGEAQRIQLATCLGSRLVGACYVLDEPSIGLHARDTARLVRILEELRDLGNTIIVVEHDPDVMRSADHIIDLGPGAGEHGGRVLFSGSYSGLLSDGAQSLTSRYLKGEQTVATLKRRRKPHPKRIAEGDRRAGEQPEAYRCRDPARHDGRGHGCVGVGKIDAGTRGDLQDACGAAWEKKTVPEDPERSEKLQCKRIERTELLSDVLLVDQSPIGRTPRSNPVTYIKAFDLVREAFASTTEADRRGYTAGHFSFNIPGGRCEVCQGDGTVTVEMQFLADVELVCEECKGTRYKSSILEVRYNGLNIHEVLQLTVREAIAFFNEIPKLVAKLRVLNDVGLGVSAAGPIGDDAVGRGSAAREAGGASRVAGLVQENAVHLRRADDRAAFRRHHETARCFSAVDRERRKHSDHRAQSRCDPERRLDHRPRAGRRRRGRPGDRGGYSGRCSQSSGFIYRSVPEAALRQIGRRSRWPARTGPARP